MGVASDVWRSLTGHHRSVVREHIGRGAPEARSLAFLMLGCGLVWVAQGPRLAREAALTGADPSQLAAYALVGWLMAWPLAFYLLAAVAHGVSRAAGGQGTPGGARLALFWSWLAAAPLALLAGAVAGLAGPSPLADAAGLAWLGAFAVLWAFGQREASVAAGPRAHAA